MERPVPYDIAAERAVLGACLLERDAIIVVRDLVSVDCFYLEKHALIYSAMLDCVDERQPPDLVTVSAKLKANEQLDLVGGIAFLGELCVDVPTAVHVEHYAKIVADHAGRRRLIELGGEVAALGYNGGASLESLQRQIAEMIKVQQAANTGRGGWTKVVVSAEKLYDERFEPEQYIIEQILPQGTMLLTGKPKTRKSWLAFNYALAVTQGGRALGRYQAIRGDVLYIDLEMGPRRLHKRLHTLLPRQRPPKGLHFTREAWPRVGEGFEGWLIDYLETNPFTRLVIVDTMVAIRSRRGRNEDPYEADKAFTQRLTDVAHKFPIALLLIHHSRKADGGDIIDDASGTTGLVGGVDNASALRLSEHDRAGGELHFRGRDIEIDGALHLKWDAQFVQWNAIEEDLTLTPERRAVLGLLRNEPGLYPKQIAERLNRREPDTRRLLDAMKKAGQVASEGGRYYGDLEDPPMA